MVYTGIITFDAGCAEEILSVFGVVVDGDGYLVKSSDWSDLIRTPEGETIYIDDFAGIRKDPVSGNLVYLKKDLPSLIRLVDELNVAVSGDI
jgi:hypothetical protein